MVVGDEVLIHNTGGMVPSKVVEISHSAMKGIKLLAIISPSNNLNSSIKFLIIYD